MLRTSATCALLLVSGCSSSSTATGASDAGAGESSVDTLSIGGKVREFAGTTEGKPLEGVKVCVYKHPEVACATTDAGGLFSLKGVPPKVEYALTYEKAGYLGFLNPYLPSDAIPVAGAAMLPEALAQSYVSAIGGTWPLGSTGIVVARAFALKPGETSPGSPTDGATASLAPASGKGPAYASATGEPSAALNATTSTGWAYFANVGPGDVEVTINHPTLKCTQVNPLGGFSASKAGAFKIPVLAGFVSAGSMICTP